MNRSIVENKNLYNRSQGLGNLLKTKLSVLFALLIFLSITATKVAGQGEPMIGEVKLFAGNFAPRGWAFCAGQLLAINEHQALFSILGTTYGGDGRTTFALPDLRGRVAIAPGTGAGLPTYGLGDKSGADTHTLTTGQLPSHNHTMVMGDITFPISADPDELNAMGPANNHISAQEDDHFASEPSPGATMTVPVNGSNLSLNLSGGSRAHNNMQPYLTTNYIIALVGVYPSRN